MEPWTLQSYTITLECPALPEIVGYGPRGKEIREQMLTVRSLKGREALGESFRYTILAQVENADFLRDPDDAAQVDLEHILHSNATIAIQGTGIGTPDPGMRGSPPRTNIGADIRYINGEITAASIKCVDDRAAVYEFVLEPFIWCAKMNRERRIFKDQNVQEVISRVFRDYQGTIEWRIGGPWSGRLDYPKREYMRQEGECDWDFAMRLMEEWGLVCWFEHRKGFHSLVISDTMGGFHPHGIAYKTLRYHTGSRIDEEHISELEIVYASTVGKVTVGDHSYMHPRLNKNLVPNRETCESNSETALSEIEIYDRAEFTQASSHREPTPEELRDEGQHFARVKLEAERCKGVRARGKGHLRALQAGRTFDLIQYPQNKANGEYLVLSCDLEITEVGASSGTWRTYSVDTSFELMPAGEYYRMPQVTHKPRIDGFELAVIVAPHEHETWIDYRHCLLIQFEWDRDGDYEGGTSIWVRVVSQWQGDEMGTIAPGRAGQMVVVSHVNGDPDRPIVAGFVVDKFNRPPFQLPHNQALYGTRIKSLGYGRESAHSVLDATPGRIQAQIASDHGKSSLSLGYNTRIDGNKGLQDARGEGYELRTDLWGVLRAAKGMLLTTVARPIATGKARDMAETVAQLTRARAQHEDMAKLAQQHQAQSVDVNQHDATQTIKTQNDAIKGDAKSDDAPSPEMTRPDLLLSSSAGIATTTADSTHQASHKDHAITAGRDVSVSTGRSFLASVRGAVSMFAYQLGVRLIAAKGKVEIQAQSDQMALAALKDITISSVNGQIVINASKGVWIGSGGSYTHITGDGITNGSPGPILEKTPSWDKPGASAIRAPLPALPLAPLAQEQAAFYSQTFDVSTVAENYGIGPAIASQPYRVYLPDGTIQQQGMLTKGSTLTVNTSTPTKVRCEIGAGDWGIAEDAYDRDEFDGAKAIA
ncbi:type VI secretion system Vgr family protein [Paraburkholderia azotifigens]|uniref:Type VI secretion system tip protein VgrG n=1 Tax=Paraburkholderia azotifigens TaxID=2057004 RepID=A0A5C6V608_9BURK|nr:type VI secretion system Vgr family protein [Paraburkholderia azotifigens]TXC79866.1 type VI secretion system tip protein VgrG [Paraburkholderia azotifigens]